MTQRASFTVSALCACLLFAICSLNHSKAFAAVPHLVRYQGQAVDSKGVPLEGPYTLTFRLYDAETGGNKLWEETQTSVPLSSGYFSVLLGQKTSFDAMDWSKPCWLSVQVNTDPELAPRQRITSVPLALRAETAEVVKTSGLTDDASALVPSGAIILWDGAACPTSYTRVAAYDDQFLIGSATAGTTGGSTTHTHGAGSYAGPSHQHGEGIGYTGSGIHITNAYGTNGTTTSWTLAIGGASGNSSVGTLIMTQASGTGPVTGTSAPANHLPPYRTILLCKKS